MENKKESNKYGEYAQPIMDELEPQFKFITKVSDNCWKVQSREDTMCQGFWVHTLSNGHIIMSGDYDGVMVRPYGAEDCLVNWMAGATTLSYFAEKVYMANKYHNCKKYSQTLADANIKQIKECHLEELEDEVKSFKEDLAAAERELLVEKDEDEMSYLQSERDDAKEYCDEAVKKLEVKSEEFDSIIECGSTETEDQYYGLLRNLEHEFDIYDIFEYDAQDYTYQLQWQHKCLVFWANKVLKGEFVNGK